MSGRLHCFPMLSRRFDLRRIMAVEQENRAFIAAKIRRFGTVDQKPDLRIVLVAVSRGQQDWLFCRKGLPVARMGQK